MARYPAEVMLVLPAWDHLGPRQKGRFQDAARLNKENHGYCIFHVEYFGLKL